MSHLESLIAEYLDWQGFLVRKNTKVGKLGHGGWEMELDIVGYHPQTGELLHYEPSIDAHSWAVRENRYRKKFGAGGKYILAEMFPWVPVSTRVRQIAIFISHPKGRDAIAGGEIMSVDELMREIRAKVLSQGVMSRAAIPEQFPLLRTIQLSECGYYKALR